MPSLWFVMPAHGRVELARICLRQLRRTCDSLADNGIDATAVVIACDDNLETARDLGFGTVERDNQFVSRRFNDGIQAAFGGTNAPQVGRYEVTGRREYRGHPTGTIFDAHLEPGPARRAIARKDIRLLETITPTHGPFTPPDGWENRTADYVMPIGSDDWIDWRILTLETMPEPDEVVGFQNISFVREDGLELTQTFLNYTGGCGMRLYPRKPLEKVGFRPAEEDRYRGCDTSILTNVRIANAGLKVMHVDTDPVQIVDWKTPGEQLNQYDQVRRRHFRGDNTSDPFEALEGVFPQEALDEMEAHYQQANRGAERLLTR